MKLKGIVSVPSDQSVKLNLVQSLPNPLHFLHRLHHACSWLAKWRGTRG